MDLHRLECVNKDLRYRKQDEDGENYIMRSFIISNLHKIL
jgi:hypothetical protein